MMNVIRPMVENITDEMLYDKVKEFLIEFDNEKYNTPIQVELLFYYHNRIFPKNQEHGKGCGTCRARVRNRLADWVLKTNNDK